MQLWLLVITTMTVHGAIHIAINEKDSRNKDKSLSHKPRQQICHEGRATLNIDRDDVAKYLRRGDTLGPCKLTAPASVPPVSAEPDQAEFCLSGANITIVVGPDELIRTLPLGKPGKCRAETITSEPSRSPQPGFVQICFPETETLAKVDINDLAVLLMKGAILGNCTSATVEPTKRKPHDSKNNPVAAPVDASRPTNAITDPSVSRGGNASQATVSPREDPNLFDDSMNRTEGGQRYNHTSAPSPASLKADPASPKSTPTTSPTKGFTVKSANDAAPTATMSPDPSIDPTRSSSPRGYTLKSALVPTLAATMQPITPGPTAVSVQPRSVSPAGESLSPTTSSPTRGHTLTSFFDPTTSGSLQSTMPIPTIASVKTVFPIPTATTTLSVQPETPNPTAATASPTTAVSVQPTSPDPTSASSPSKPLYKDLARDEALSPTAATSISPTEPIVATSTSPIRGFTSKSVYDQPSRSLAPSTSNTTQPRAEPAKSYSNKTEGVKDDVTVAPVIAMKPSLNPSRGYMNSTVSPSSNQGRLQLYGSDAPTLRPVVSP